MKKAQQSINLFSLKTLKKYMTRKVMYHMFQKKTYTALYGLENKLKWTTQKLFILIRILLKMVIILSKYLPKVRFIQI